MILGRQQRARLGQCSQVRGMGSNGVDLGPESLLQDAEATPITDTRSRLNLALRYLANWYRATEGSDEQSVWWVKIDDVRAKVEAAFVAMDPAKVFPGVDELATYHDAQLAFADLWRQLTFSIDTLPRPDLITQAADFVDTLVHMPGTILTTTVDIVTKAAGDATKKAITNLWPVLLVAGVLGGGYLAVKAKVFK